MQADSADLPLGSLRVDITPHKREPGTPRPFVGRFTAPSDLGLPSVEVLVDAFSTDLNLEFVGNQLMVTGTIGVDWHGPCRRCIEPVAESLSIPVQEVFELDPVDGETYRREDDFADLRPMVVEAILLSLPLAPLCDPQCSGPDPDRYQTTVAGDDPGVDDDSVDVGDAPGSKDPRWAALDDLTFG